MPAMSTGLSFKDDFERVPLRFEEETQVDVFASKNNKTVTWVFVNTGISLGSWLDRAKLKILRSGECRLLSMPPLNQQSTT